jgi:hypothetical protein
VNIIDSESRVIVKTRYFPNNGTTKDVAGMISIKSKKNRPRARKIEIDRVTFSPEFDDNKNTRIVKNDMLVHGIIKLTM